VRKETLDIASTEQEDTAVFVTDITISKIPQSSVFVNLIAVIILIDRNAGA
jgi:hypothetical protein